MSEMQAQCRICPVCHDDHGRDEPCGPERLLYALEFEREKGGDVREMLRVYVNRCQECGTACTLCPDCRKAHGMLR